MEFVCKPCNVTFRLKTNLARHELSHKHLKCIACVTAVSQPKITDFFALEAKITEQNEAITVLSEKVVVLETITAALQTQTASLMEQVTALVTANVRLAHAAEIAELKLAHALEMKSLLAKKPRHREESAEIESFFKLGREYDDNSQYSGFTILCDNINKIFAEKPDLPKGNLEDRIYDIFKKEVYKKTKNAMCFSGAQTSLNTLHKLLQFSAENKAWLDSILEEVNTRW
jgi:hypothetical protein